MASFHFRIKTDKKPNGTKVKAIEHLQYINRDGKYQDVEQRRSYQKERNIIAGLNTKEALNGQYGILYNSPYGKITNTNVGLLVTDKPSDETLAIALLIARESMRNEKLIINGTPTFKTQLLSVAANMDLPPDIFADKALCDLYQKFIKEQKENAREIRNGRSSELGRSRRPNFKIGTSIGRESLFDDDSIESNAQSNCKKTLRDLTRQGLCLPTLSSRNLVSNARQSSKSKLLLPGIPFSDLVDRRSDEGHLMRRKKYSIKHYAELSAKKILKNIEQHMDVVFAASHAAYINRESAFTQRGGCIYKNHQLPAWAKDDPKKFFAAADRYELKSNYRYKEIEAALPNELNLDQQREIIEQFLSRHLSDSYYAYAIHDKIGAMSNGEHNTHVHIMFSERKIDEVERKCPRAASRFFLYPKRGAKTFEDKRKGGSPKDRKWSTGTYITEMRKDFAEIQNAILEKYGYIDRVDHRSLKAQRESALLDGDEFLANLLDRIPEQHISESVISPNHPEVINIKRYRNFKREYQDLLFKTELLQHKINESKIADIAKKNDNKLPEILLSDEFEKSEIDSDVLTELKNNLVSAIKDVQAWKNTLVSKAQAKEKAILGFMPPEDREVWQQYKAMCKKRDEWIHLNERFNKPNDYQTDALAAYNELKPALEDKILKLNQEISALTPAILQIKKNLSRPHMIQKIQSHTAKVMFNNRHAYTQYRKANEHLHNSLEALEQVLFENQLNTTNPTQKVFTTMEICNHLRRRFSGLIKEQKRLSVVRDKLSQKVFTLNRANKLAENLYVNGAFKILRTKNHELDKAEKAWQENKLKLDLAIEAFNKSSTPKFWQSDLKKQHENKKAHLTEKLNALMQQKDTFKSLRQSLDEEHNKLIIQCSTPEAKQKIAEIAAGIIQKNQKTAIQLEEIISKSKEINHKINNLKNQIQAVKERLKNEKGTVRYKLRASIPQGNYDAVKIIANAMAGSSKDAQLVAQLKNNTAMDKDWDMMTDDEKAEVMRKKTLRDI